MAKSTDGYDKVSEAIAKGSTVFWKTVFDQQFQTPNFLALKSLHRENFTTLDNLSDRWNDTIVGFT
jgi:hypothetical protein